MGELTVCARCKYCDQNREPSLDHLGNYSQLYCKATPIRGIENKITGEVIYHQNVYCIDERIPFAFCKDVNDGYCPKFVRFTTFWEDIKAWFLKLLPGKKFSDA